MLCAAVVLGGIGGSPVLAGPWEPSPYAQTAGAEIAVREPLVYAVSPVLTRKAAPLLAPESAVQIHAPAGFSVVPFATGLADPQALAIAPSGIVLVAEAAPGRITVLIDRSGDGLADERHVLARGFARPHALAVDGETLLVSDMAALWQLPLAGEEANQDRRRPLTRPGALGSGGVAWHRPFALSADGERIFVGVGARSDAGTDPEVYGTIQQMARDGTGQKSLASGLRAPGGIAVQPGSGALFAVVAERPLADGYLAADFLARVEKGDFFGWPVALLGPRQEPTASGPKHGLVAMTRAPDMLFEPLAAPAAIAFYTDGPYPERYRGGAFVSLRGAGAGASPTGGKVVFVPFRDAAPIGVYENFLVGFRRETSEGVTLSGRPAGLAVAHDGSLLVADDLRGVVWRVTYMAGDAAQTAPVAQAAHARNSEGGPE